MPVALITPEEMIHKPGPEAQNPARRRIRGPLSGRFDLHARIGDRRRDDPHTGRRPSAALAGGERLTAKVFASVPELRVVARAGVGFDRVDVPAATKHNVVVTITPTANHAAVAEHTLALMFAVADPWCSTTAYCGRGSGSGGTLRPLRGRTIGLIGLGRIGRSTATRCLGLGMKVLAHELFPDQKFVKEHGIELVDFRTLLSRSDYVSIHCPLNEKTKGIMNAAAFAAMKPGSVFINTARGGLVVEADLIAALQSGHLGGAGLDVFEQEPTDPKNPLFKMDNVVVCPHLGGGDTQSIADMGAEAANCVVSLYRGGWPADAAVLNGSLKEGWRWAR